MYFSRLIVDKKSKADKRHGQLTYGIYDPYAYSMPLNSALHFAQKICDSIFEMKAPDNGEALDKKSVRIVAHRGGYGPGPLENTIEAFLMAKQAGVWGIELDVRWSKDLIPFIHHDAAVSAQSLGPQPTLSSLNWHDIAQKYPQICTLSAVAAALKGTCHLMIEVKEHLSAEREESFKAALSHLDPIADYHILTLDPSLLALSQYPRESFVFVSELNFKFGSKFVLENRWGGVAGHYLLFNDGLRQKHHHAGQLVGVGFVNGINNLYRQVQGQADWIFSDCAISLQQQL